MLHFHENQSKFIGYQGWVKILIKPNMTTIFDPYQTLWLGVYSSKLLCYLMFVLVLSCFLYILSDRTEVNQLSGSHQIGNLSLIAHDMWLKVYIVLFKKSLLWAVLAVPPETELRSERKRLRSWLILELDKPYLVAM